MWGWDGGSSPIGIKMISCMPCHPSHSRDRIITIVFKPFVHCSYPYDDQRLCTMSFPNLDITPPASLPPGETTCSGMRTAVVSPRSTRRSRHPFHRITLIYPSHPFLRQPPESAGVKTTQASRRSTTQCPANDHFTSIFRISP